MKRLFLLLPAIFLLVSCGNGAFFPPSREIEDMSLVRVLGIDLEDGNIKITGLTAGGASSESAAFSGSGATLSEAVGLLSRLPAGKNAVFSHVESVLIGEKAAGRVIPETLDFISRSNELRLGTRLFIVRGDTAAGLIEDSGGELGDLLSLLGENSPYLGVFAFTAGECSAALKRSGACLIECVKYDENVAPCGFAAIRDGKLALFLEERASEGAAIIMNRLQGGEVSLSGRTLMINGAETRFIPVEGPGGEPGAKLEVSLTARLAGTDGRTNAGNAEDELTLYVGENIRLALEAALKLGADLYDIRGSLMEARPFSAGAFSGFSMPSAEIDWSVSAKITGSFDLREGAESVAG